MTTYTAVTLITGRNERGNEYAYWKSSESNTPEIPSMGKWDEWFDGLNEVFVSARYIANHIIPSVVKVRFGNFEMTRQEWEANGCPFELCREQMDVLELAAEQHKAMMIVLDVANASTPQPAIHRLNTAAGYDLFSAMATKSEARLQWEKEYLQKREAHRLRWER